MSQTSNKATVKSCGCTQCRRGKASKAAGHQMKLEERAARHSAKQALKTNPEEAVIAPAHRGSYTD